MEWKEQSLEIGSKKVHYYFHAIGNKPAFIFLHGFMDNGMCYDRVAEQFANDYDLYLIDARGHGKSSDMPKNPTYLDLAQDVEDVCQHCGLSRVLVMGHSMGGVVAAKFAAQFPSRVQGVVLEDPGFYPKKNTLFVAIACFGLSLVYHHTDNPLSMEAAIKRSKKLNSKWSERDQLVWAAAQREFVMHYPSKNLKVIFSGAKADDILPDIKAPILLITSEGGIVKKKEAQRYKKLNSDLDWQYVPKAGHNIRREQFDLLIGHIQHFLKPIN
jgi:pimeloyl-ACP methyl ester carboxylesterase